MVCSFLSCIGGDGYLKDVANDIAKEVSKKMFEFIDLNNNKFISPQEVQLGSILLNQKDLVKIISDTYKSVSYEEFHKLFLPHINKMLTKTVLRSLRDSFDAFDKDGSGYIDIGEIDEGTIKILDTDADKKVNFTEYAALMVIRKPKIINTFKNDSKTITIALFLHLTEYKDSDILRMIINESLVIPVSREKILYKTKLTNIDSIIIEHKKKKVFSA